MPLLKTNYISGIVTDCSFLYLGICSLCLCLSSFCCLSVSRRFLWVSFYNSNLETEKTCNKDPVTVVLYVPYTQDAPLVVIIMFTDTVKFCDIHGLKSLQFVLVTVSAVCV